MVESSIHCSLCKIPTASTVNTAWLVQFVGMAPFTELNSKLSEKFKFTALKDYFTSI